MTTAVHDCVVACNWKLQSILRAKRFYSDALVFASFKSHILSFIEYRKAKFLSVLEKFDLEVRRALGDGGGERGGP